MRPPTISSRTRRCRTDPGERDCSVVGCYEDLRQRHRDLVVTVGEGDADLTDTDTGELVLHGFEDARDFVAAFRVRQCGD